MILDAAAVEGLRRRQLAVEILVATLASMRES